MSQSKSSSFTSGCNRWRQQYCSNSCNVGGSTRNGGLTPICNCGENITTFQPQTNPKTELRKP